MISATDYERATGRAPVEDDLERANCAREGLPGHFSCGWCETCDLPRAGGCACGPYQPFLIDQQIHQAFMDRLEMAYFMLHDECPPQAFRVRYGETLNL